MLVISLRWNKIKQLRIKLTIIFSAVFIFLMATLVLANALFMENVIIKYTEYTMRRNLETILEYSEDISMDSVQVGRKSSPYMVTMYDLSDTRPLDQQRVDPVLKQFIRDMPHEIKEMRAEGENTKFVFTPKNEKYGPDMFLLYIHGDALLAIYAKGKTSFDAINVNAIFMAVASILVFIVGVILIWMISTRIGKDVQSLTDKTFKMSLCDFSDPIIVDNEDEVASLAKHINHLSHELESVIEDLKESNQSLNTELEKERNMEQMRRQFVSDVSHELKNPLSMIQGYADGLYYDIPQTDEDEKYYQKVIVDETERLGHLLKDLLDLSSYQSGTFTLKYETVDLNRIVEVIVSKYAIQLEDKHLLLDVKQKAVPVIEADGGRLEQIIVNLVTNAIKYSYESGRIVIETGSEKDCVYVKISNTGPLISKEQMELIWNSFHRIDSTKTGNGLGLAIVKSLVSLHGGTCNVDIVENMNCFKVSFPIR